MEFTKLSHGIVAKFSADNSGPYKLYLNCTENCIKIYSVMSYLKISAKTIYCYFSSCIDMLY